MSCKFGPTGLWSGCSCRPIHTGKTLPVHPPTGSQNLLLPPTDPARWLTGRPKRPSSALRSSPKQGWMSETLHPMLKSYAQTILHFHSQCSPSSSPNNTVQLLGVQALRHAPTRPFMSPTSTAKEVVLETNPFPGLLHTLLGAFLLPKRGVQTLE